MNEARLHLVIQTQANRIHALTARNRELRARIARLERGRDLSVAARRRLRSKLQTARRDRELWKHRYTRDTA